MKSSMKIGNKIGVNFKGGQNRPLKRTASLSFLIYKAILKAGTYSRNF